ncbi:kinesin-like protein KIN-12G [Zea mays]|uniref:Kinesin-like protein KIN-12E n=4 Tax=Zea mays TaxID=4577 RepID=A0A1D6GCP8_MAIZE|nr:kinesin-like protein KIN-12G [Zea mays]AQK61437.1 Kinesin-like protein KIN-12E [Zea mays]AQK61441.1 Kinesin-like protein KIN-12E [Zea mays]|eukprot:XP_023155864.1 kinesin-like protein KIN-12G [Zea mays]
MMHLDGVDDELGDGDCAPSTARFELQEDPSFWKDNNVQVVIRIRPLSGSEISLQGQKRCVRQDSSKGQCLAWTGNPESRFTFDLVADEHVSQEDMFKVAGVPMVENCIAGYNSCMFAYGQAGSGKTHTMLGDIENVTPRNSVNCGMAPRVFDHLFARIQKEKELRIDETLRFTCKCSFLEIYNEQILDLLNPNSVNLQIREDSRKGVHVESLTEHEISNAREALQQLIEGAANRKVAATNMNHASSRSHSVFTCLIKSKWESKGINYHRFSRLNLVDLAGSERQKSSGAKGERLKEATNINKSLSTLGLVITNLIAVSNKKSQHVPYRDSKLTFLLQDSLGGNSKTTIIANISPSSCCAAETLSTLKFAQRAKYIRNNAIINEDASGDVLSMRLLQIQKLKRKDCDAALVAAFKREQEKEAAQLKAMIDANQIAEQLEAQKTEEVRSFKMRLKFCEERIKILEQVASGKLSVEAHLLQEKENLVKELEVLQCQLDRNPEITKFAMENLQLKEDLRRLQSFVDEDEREMMHEQIIVLQDRLLEALDWKLMHEKGPVTKALSLFEEPPSDEEKEFLRLQAIQNEREIELLRKKLTFCLEAKENLERHVNELTTELELTKKHDNTDKESKPAQLQDQGEADLHNLSDAQMEFKTLVDAIASASQREAEAHETVIGLAKDNEELRMQLKVLIEDNKRLIELYQHAFVNVEANQDGNPVNEDLLNAQPAATSDLHAHNSSNVEEEPKIVDEKCTNEDNFSRVTSVELCLQLEEMDEENEGLMGLHEKTMQERDVFKRKILEQSDSEAVKDILLGEKDAEMSEAAENPEVKHVHDSIIVALKDVLQIVRSKLELVQDKVVSTQDAVKYFKLLEMASGKATELYSRIELQYLGAQRLQEDITVLKSVLSESQEKIIAFEGKYFLPAASCWNMVLKTKSPAESRLDASFESMNQKKERFNHLQTRKNELSAARRRARESETELRSKIDGLKVKLGAYGAQRKEEEKVLFAIDNLDTSTAPMHKPKNYGKATAPLKSDEDWMKLRCELQKAREQFFMVQKEIKNINKCDYIDCEIAVLEAEIEDSWFSMLESDIERFVLDSTFTEIWEGRAKDMEASLVEYQDCVFQVSLKEEEIKMCNESLQYQARDRESDELQSKLNQAMRELGELLQDRRCLTDCSLDEPMLPVVEKVATDLEAVRIYVDEAKQLLLVDNQANQ